MSTIALHAAINLVLLLCTASGCSTSGTVPVTLVHEWVAHCKIGLIFLAMFYMSIGLTHGGP